MGDFLLPCLKSIDFSQNLFLKEVLLKFIPLTFFCSFVVVFFSFVWGFLFLFCFWCLLWFGYETSTADPFVFTLGPQLVTLFWKAMGPYEVSGLRPATTLLS